MKKITLSLILMTILAISCTNDSSITSKSNLIPSGNLVIQQTGKLISSNNVASSGTLELLENPNGEQYIRFKNDFKSNFEKGGLTVFILKTDDNLNNIDISSVNQNSIKFAGIIEKSGELYLQIDPSRDTKFLYVSLWNSYHGHSFGHAKLN